MTTQHKAARKPLPKAGVAHWQLYQDDDKGLPVLMAVAERDRLYWVFKVAQLLPIELGGSGAGPDAVRFNPLEELDRWRLQAPDGTEELLPPIWEITQPTNYGLPARTEKQKQLESLLNWAYKTAAQTGHQSEDLFLKYRGNGIGVYAVPRSEGGKT